MSKLGLRRELPSGAEASVTDAQLALPLLKEAPLTPLDVLRQGGGDEGESVSLVRRAAGVFYTPRSISDHLSTLS